MIPANDTRCKSHVIPKKYIIIRLARKHKCDTKYQFHMRQDLAYLKRPPGHCVDCVVQNCHNFKGPLHSLTFFKWDFEIIHFVGVKLAGVFKSLVKYFKVNFETHLNKPLNVNTCTFIHTQF